MFQSAIARSVVRIVGLLCLCVGPPHYIPAQDQNARLTASFLEVAPFGLIDAQGGRSGFFVDLAEEIGKEVGVEIDYVHAGSTRDFVQFQVSGQTQIIAGVGRLPPLEGSNVFSDPIATETLRLTVLSENVARLSDPQIERQRIGIVPPAVGSALSEFLERNEPIVFDTPEAALFSLLKGKVDAILIPEPVAFSMAREAGVDQRITFAGEPLRTFTRHVAIHQSRADLLDAVNAAIARMDKDGRLQQLRETYFLDAPAPPPDVLTVGVTEFPPYNIYNSDGTFTGFGVEAVRDLLALAGLEAEFKAISPAEFGHGPSSETYDMLPQAGINGARHEIMDFTLPIERFEIAVFARTGETEGLAGLDSLRGQVVGVLSVNVSARMAERHGGLDLKHFDTRPAMLRALAEGEVDALLYPAETLRLEIKRMGFEGLITEVSPPLRIVERAPALRFGLGEVRERLNAVIPGYLISGDYDELREEFFGEPVFWTPLRVYSTLGAAAALILALTGYVVWSRLHQREKAFRQQARDLDLERQHAADLSALIEKLELSNREQAEFTYAVSHDLKSPANTIGMLIEEMRELQGLSQDCEGLLSEMSATNHRMRQLVDDVLTYSRIVDESVAPETVDLNAVVQDVLSDLAFEISDASAEISTDPLPRIPGHRTQLTILFQNLIANAVKFRVPDRVPRIAIIAGDGPDRVHVTIADNGIGIPEEHRRRIFGLFQRLHAQSEYEGTGLGLTICRRILTTHGGSIDFAPSVEGGAAFELTFRKVWNHAGD